MSESDNSYKFSESIQKYYSAESLSHSNIQERARCPQRLMDIISDNFRRMQCIKNGEQRETASVEPARETTSEQIAKSKCWRRMAVRGDNRRTLSAARHVVDEEFELSMRERRPLTLPTSFASTSAPGIVYEKIDAQSGSEVDLEPTENSSQTNAAGIEENKEESLAKLILNKQQTVMILNFPQLDKLVQSASKTDFIREDGSENSVQQENIDTGNEKVHFPGTASNSSWPSTDNTNGEVRVYDTGLVTISFGKNVFELTKTDRPPYEQEVVRVDIDEDTHTSKTTSLGLVHHYVDVLRQKEDEYDSDDTLKDGGK